MTYKQIEASREARLWITQVIVPLAGMVTATVVLKPEIKDAVTTKFNDVKNRIKYRNHK